MDSIAVKYAKDVISGKILACEYIILACKRYFDDISKSIEKGIYFDEKSAKRAIGFIEKLKHTKGEYAGRNFKLEPWQQFVIWNIFGWKRSDGSRRFRKAYVEVSRKNGKTTLSSGIGLYMLFGDKEQRAEIYSAATTRQQAKICFDEATAIVRATTLRNRIKVFTNALVYEATGSRFAPLSSDYGTLDGLNPSCAIIDEFHAHKSSGVYDVIVSAMGARLQPLLFIITTAGFDKTGPCFQERRTCINILRGIIEDEYTFAAIYTQDSEEEWDVSDMWIKSNPNMDISVRKEYIEERVHAAKNNTSEMVNVKTKNLNMWVDAADVWISDEKWRCSSFRKDVDWLKGKSCYGGLDLSNTGDITSFALLFNEDEKYQIITFNWIPKDTMIERFRKENISYPDWERRGYIYATDGNVIDRSFVEKTIVDLSFQYDIKSIAYDRYDANETVIRLTDQGLIMNPFGQGFISMSQPTKMFEELVLTKKLEHFGNPVLRWAVSNVEIRRDPAGNIKPDKGKSRQKIDPVVASIMALGEMMTHRKEEDDPYESRGLLY